MVTKKAQIRTPIRLIGFVLIACLSLGVSESLMAVENKFDFQAFLELHYQSQIKQTPEIPAYTLREIITPRAAPMLNPHLAILGPNPKPIIMTEPSLNILGEQETEPPVLTPPTLTAHISLNNNDAEIIKTIKNNNHSSAKLAIIIDDIGNNKHLDIRVAELPGAVTLAILPHTPFSKTIAELAYSKQKNIMLHAPMESLQGRRLGDGALTKDLSEQDFVNILQDDIDSIPHVSGLNNHMGSALTQDEQAMRLVMQAIVKNKLFFVDSRTTPESIAGDLAKEYNIDHVSRNVFLDNETNYEYIDQAFQHALKISRKTGFALVIGHPYPETIAYLESALPELENQGIALISVSDFLLARSEGNKNQLKDLAKK